MEIKELILEQLREDAKNSGVPFLRNYIRVSGAGQCLRKRRYMMEHQEETDEKTDNSLLTVNFGNAFHEWLQSILSRKLKLNFIYEKRLVNPQLRITGAFDGLIYNHEDNKYYLIDFKTTNPYKLKHLEKQQSADINHIKQLAIYDYLLHNPHTRILEVIDGEARLFPIEHYPLIDNYRNSKRELKVVYIMRDAITIKEFTYEPFLPEIQELINQELRDIAQVRKLPSKQQPKTQNTWECKYCPYITLCEGLK